MYPRATFIATLLSLLVHRSLFAQSLGADPKWGIETELFQPFIPTVHIITLKATKTIWGSASTQHGDLMLGIYARPYIAHDVVEWIEEYMLSVGYRHYFVKGFHAEAQYLAGYVYGENNKIDGQDYESFVHFAEASIGYRFQFAKQRKVGWYITPQFGYLQGLNDELIIGPRGGKPDYFVIGKLLAGVTF